MLKAPTLNGRRYEYSFLAMIEFAEFVMIKLVLNFPSCNRIKAKQPKTEKMKSCARKIIRCVKCLPCMQPMQGRAPVLPRLEQSLNTKPE